nr:MAG TPA: hypothetical protein [Caudoviricetes sp.]
MNYKMYKAKLETCLDDLMDKDPTPARIEGVGLLLDVLDRLDCCIEDTPAVAAESVDLDPATMQRWVDGMVNADGTRGAHWSMDQTTAVGRAHGVDMAEIGPECWWVTMCMMYSDYNHTAAMFGLDREDFYASLAKDFLSDPDAPGGAKAKLEGYYRGVVR